MVVEKALDKLLQLIRKVKLLLQQMVSFQEGEQERQIPVLRVKEPQELLQQVLTSLRK